MDLTFTSEQLLLKDSAERYLSERYRFNDRATYLANAKGWDNKVWSDFAEFGWLALPFSTAHDGLGAGMVELSILGQAFGAALVVEPYLPSIVLSGYLLETLGNPSQHTSELAPLIRGEKIFALAHDEAASRIAAAPVTAQAARTANGWQLQGLKAAVLGAAYADYFIVSARMPDENASLALFVVPRAAAGVTVAPYAQIDDTRAGNVRFEQVAVSAAQRLMPQAGSTIGVKNGAAKISTEGAIESVLQTAIDRAIVFAAAQTAGSMRAALDATVSYTKTRQQFGQPLAANQVIKHRLVDMALASEEASAITLRAALLATHEAAIAAKIKVSGGARYVAEQAIQLHGGMGVTDELNIGAYFKQMLSFELQFGSARHHAQAQFAQLRERAHKARPDAHARNEAAKVSA